MNITPANTSNNAPQKEWVSPRIDISPRDIVEHGGPVTTFEDNHYSIFS